MGLLSPVAPSLALSRLLHTTAEEIAERRRRETGLAEAFGPLPRIEGRHPEAAGTPAITVLSGLRRINAAIARATRRPSSSSRRTASPPAGPPSRACSSRGSRTPPSPTGSA